MPSNITRYVFVAFLALLIFGGSRAGAQAENIQPRKLCDVEADEVRRSAGSTARRYGSQNRSTGVREVGEVV